MKKYFITGLVILLPLMLTLIVVGFFFNVLTEPFLGLTQAVLHRYGLMEHGFLFLSATQVQALVSQVLILLVLIGFTILLGIVGRWFFVHYVIRSWEYLIHRIPLVNAVYRGCQDVIKTIFTADSNAFKQVVMVRFPSPDSLTIGLVTCESLRGIKQITGSDLMAVFVPTTPNPTSGFLVMVKKGDVIPLDMRIEDAFKYVVSCGVITMPFKKQGDLISEEII
ncbi:MAG: DUF502 domain-containing protein [Parachlamydiaceae bacterium]|nr:DUF502 domain-containing protein [Parachlamydiaceae bacterium]